MARALGEEPISSMERPRRIAVILNPMAGGGKAKSLFEKSALPLLHLAGVDVSVITVKLHFLKCVCYVIVANSQSHLIA